MIVHHDRIDTIFRSKTTVVRTILILNILSRANLDLDRIRQAAADLIGTHDFRSFCKLDITKTEPTFIRRIDHITVEQLIIDNDQNSTNPG